MSFNAALKHLHDSIVTGDATFAAPHVRIKPRLAVAAQIAIYSDAYRLRLRQAVLGDYPCVTSVLGDGTMRKFVDAYVEATPSLSYNFDFYPFGFWRYVQAHHSHPEIGELAELEGAIAETYMGQGDEPLTPQNLPPLDEETLGKTKFTLRAPFRLLRFAYDVESAMATWKCGKAISIIRAKPLFILIHRHNNEVRRRVLEEGEYHLLDALRDTDSFDAAIQKALLTTGTDEASLAPAVARWMPRWINEGFLSA